MSACQLVICLLVSFTWRETSEIAPTTESDSGEDDMKGGYIMFTFMLNILADLKLNCCNVREFRNHFGEKIFSLLFVSFLRIPRLVGLAISVIV